jgi:hypothetical protein
MIFDKELTDVQIKIFNITVIITWILYIAIALGLSVKAPEYLDTLQYYIKIYVSLFLMYRFNPFRNVRFTNLDAKIAFTAGALLFTTTYINAIIQNYLQDITYFLKNQYEKLTNY